MTSSNQIVLLSIIVAQTSLTVLKCLGKRQISGTQTTTTTTQHEDAAASQLLNFLKSKPNPERMTTSWGAPVSSKTAVLTAGLRGPLLLQDTVYIDDLTHFSRERIPERATHAKGAGAFGHFEVTNDITEYTKAVIFSKIGKRTPCFVRFSTVFGERGSSDTPFEYRGFAQKYYTEDGNWDLVGINQPIFAIRDPILLPSVVHIARKKNPVTNLPDENMFWDFITQRPEQLLFIMRIFSDLGTPDGYRKMDGYGVNTFKFVNANGTAVFCKFHLKTVQGIHNLTAQQAHQLKADDPDYATRDLFNAIANGDSPKWDMKIQVMTFEQAENYRWNPFDSTKPWLEDEFPLIPVGRLTLNKNPTNYFEQVEQAAFGPGRMIPGIEASPDKILQGRMFVYPDAQFHRLGPNFMKLPINCPFQVNNTQIDGAMRFDGNEWGAPTYHPNTFNGPKITGKPDSSWSIEKAIVERFESGDEANYDHAAIFWNSELNEGARGRMVANIAASLGQVTVPRIQALAVDEFSKVNCHFGQMLSDALGIPASKQCSPGITKMRV